MMVVPARLLGEEKFSLAYGFMLAGEGVGVYFGPPLVGDLCCSIFFFLNGALAFEVVFCNEHSFNFSKVFKNGQNFVFPEKYEIPSCIELYLILQTVSTGTSSLF